MQLVVLCSEGLDGDGSVQEQVQEEAPVTKESRSHLLEQSRGFPVVITIAKDFVVWLHGAYFEKGLLCHEKWQQRDLIP